MESLREGSKNSSMSQLNKEKAASGISQDDDIFEGNLIT
jgi:hypothetical protein